MGVPDEALMLHGHLNPVGVPVEAQMLGTYPVGVPDETLMLGAFTLWVPPMKFLCYGCLPCGCP